MITLFKSKEQKESFYSEFSSELDKTIQINEKRKAAREMSQFVDGLKQAIKETPFNDER